MNIYFITSHHTLLITCLYMYTSKIWHNKNLNKSPKKCYCAPKATECQFRKKRAMKINVWRLIMWGLKETYTLRYFSNWVESREDITLPEQPSIPVPSVSWLLMNVLVRMTILLFPKNQFWGKVNVSQRNYTFCR